MGRFKAPAPAPPTPARRYAGIKKDLSLVIKFDDLVRDELVLVNGCEQEFLRFVKNAKEWRKRWQFAEVEVKRLNSVLKEKERDISVKETQIKQARIFVDDSHKTAVKLTEERDNLRRQLQSVKDLLLADGGKTINNETLERIRRIDVSEVTNIKHAASKKFMNPVVEESCESLLDASDLSFEDSRDDILGESRMKMQQPYKRRSSAGKRMSHSFGQAQFPNEKIITQTTVTVSKNGAHAESFIETHPVTMDLEELRKLRKRSRQSRELLDNCRSPYAPTAPPMEDIIPTTPSHPVKRTFSNAGSVPSRAHTFVKKGSSLSANCNGCGKRIKFGKPTFKCRDCGVLSHSDCTSKVPLPCVSYSSRTPNAKLGSGCILADFTPIEPPMIPALLDVCVKEVEKRGLREVGIYRIPGNETETNQLLEKLMHGKGPVPSLSNCDIHNVASAVKKFLRGLKEPVIPSSLWHMFVDAASNPDSTFAESEIYQAISELPRPNRDTLALLMIHFQTVSQWSVDNRMTIDNIAVAIGPTIVGYSSSDPITMMEESNRQQVVMRALLAISADYWSAFLNPDNEPIFNYIQPSQPKSSKKYYMPHSPDMIPPPTGGPAKRTRSKQLSRNFTRKHDLFQSPML